jgi:predicted nucleotide-binding protein
MNSTVEEVLSKLRAAGYSLQDQVRLANDVCTQLRFDGGVIVNVYDNGTVMPQGKHVDTVRNTLGLPPAGANSGRARLQSQRVFVVYGHDPLARAELETMLLRWKLEPLLLDQLPSGGMTIIEKLEQYTSEDVRFAVVLATPDDRGHRREHPGEAKCRARQNVILELGMLLAKLGRNRVAILLKKEPDFEPPSDIHGLMYLPFENSVREVKVDLAREMRTQGLRLVGSPV